jgi:pantoate--beta-alanine ligase
MDVIETVEEVRAARERMRGSVGLVPTMGFLHEGHMSLVRRGRSENGTVIVSIFVNPTQFGPEEDFERYPRNMERDLELLAAEGVDAVFAPSPAEMYPPDFDDWVDPDPALADRLEGESRPGFFRGVCTVVARLLRMVEPDRVYFGQKDAQQLRVVQKMVQDERLAVEIVPMPIVREPDGLAMSSRNAYLSPGERAHALVLSRALAEARRLVASGETDAELVRRDVRRLIEQEPGVEIDYVSVADEETLEELRVIERPALALIAARVGSTRLIDNTVLLPQGAVVSPELAALLSRDFPDLPSPA